MRSGRIVSRMADAARLIALLATCLGGLAVAACQPADDALVTHSLFVMATQVDIGLPATADDARLIADIERELRQFGTDYYAWGDGELAALNQALSAGRSFSASPSMAELLTSAQRIAELTGGAFDPGVGGLVELWGFDTAEPPAAPPTDAAIEATRRDAGSIADLEITDGIVTARAGDPATHRRYLLDLGGIAKGLAVDRIAARLDAAGIAPALINAGGDLRVIGNRGDRPWRIGIAAPRDDGLLGTLRLEPGEAAFTSGDYERYFEHDGARLHHILDPTTGYPANHTRAVTVIADSGVIADAAATALLVAGPARWRNAADALGVAAVLRVDASGAIEMTPPMRDRFQAESRFSSDIIATAD